MYGNSYGYNAMQGGMQGYGGGYGGFQGGQGYGGMNDGFQGGGGGYSGRMGGRGGGGFAPRPAGANGMGGGMGGGPRPRMDQEFVEGKLFLGGLDNATSKEALLEYCGQWGEVSDYVLMEGRGFGFVTFKDPQNAQQFLEQREHVIDGKKVEAKAAVPKNSGNSPMLTRKMFVGGTGEISDEEFRDYFLGFGEIEDSVVLRKPDGGSRGFGFVTFKDEMSVEKCLVMQHFLNGKQVEIKRAVKKEEMGGGPGAGGGMGAGAGGGGGGYVGGAGGPVRGGKEADWICPDQNCANKNFGWRQACNRCQIPKPAHLKTGGMNMGMGGGYGGRGGTGGEFEGPGAYGAGPTAMGMGGMGMGGYGNFPAGGYGAMGGYGGMGGMGGMGGFNGGMGMGFPAAAAAGGYGGGYGGSGGAGGGYEAGRYRPY
ncbi:hypothetical protein COCSUDRAFT_66433 [Coccomyxa subellipsoidea C-169]|uniref:RNA-binding domain-containing protein n=1 Tax=Coccomyxa subellipsoidea (strain C-169) TaxID=574566 RepID=I0YWV4_COCSC|nr:hypothetical protein COCSUDRAFT_66433 [Coccomyxa subellipsoidea C-169]EIE22873.1 hypothetical protein COCSUDRAFT_66433 [Coccomyxa subellipsoidea C-169]|eukprot:XP_005647417.1 hypothetical protein COCSUDRAFT_66433 [Coccomyxa subellipsoidea C-169]